MTAWNTEKKVLAGLVALGPGYPKIVRSDGFPGLKPGFHVVALGVCAPGELEKPLRALQGLRREVYAREVTLPAAEATCPRGEQGFEALELERVTRGDRELSLIGFLASKSDKTPLPWAYRILLRDGKGTLLDWEEVDEKDRVTNGCDVPSPEKVSDGVKLAFSCEGPGTGPAPEKFQVLMSFTISEHKIVQDVKRTP